MADKENNKRLVLWIVAIGGMVSLSAVVAVVILVTLFPGFDQGEDQWLHIKINSSITEVHGSASLFTDPAEQPALSTELSASIRSAATDDAISGIYLDIRSLNLGWAQVQDIRSAIDEFRDQGKDCVAWSNAYDNKTYYLASGCTEVHMAPAGMPMVHGLSVTQMYFKELFDDLKIEPQFEHVGDYKSAVEPYLSNHPSDEAQEATDLLLDDLYEQLISGIAHGRGMSYEQAQGLIEDPPITPQDALDRGMLDGLSWYDQMQGDVVSGSLVPLKGYLEERRAEWDSGDSTIAVIYAQGTIIDGKSSEDFMGGRYIGDWTLRSQLRKAREDNEVVAVVLRVSSPGGSGSASDAIWREVELTQQRKPVVVSMGDYAASGGYYISMGSDWIVAEPGTITGSIGVFGGKINLKDTLHNYGIRTWTYKRGPYSNMFSSFSSFEDTENEVPRDPDDPDPGSPPAVLVDQAPKFRDFLGAFYTRFIEQAADGRGMTVEELERHAKGRVWTGSQAFERGLVDEIGGLDRAIEKAAELAGVESPRIQRIPEAKGFLETLVEGFSDPEKAQALTLLGLDEEILTPLIQLQMVTRTTGPILLLPGNLRVQ